MTRSNGSMPRYESILFRDLQIPKAFLRKHEAEVDKRLRRAAASLLEPWGEFQAFNDCFHVASSVVLCGSNRVGETLERIRNSPVFVGTDPATMVTVAALYYLLRSAAVRTTEQDQKKRIDRISRRLSEANWMVGRDAVESLGIGAGRASGSNRAPGKMYCSQLRNGLIWGRQRLSFCSPGPTDLLCLRAHGPAAASGLSRLRREPPVLGGRGCLPGDPFFRPDGVDAVLRRNVWRGCPAIEFL